MADEIHELTAAYALDALDDADRRRFEEHLASCERCQEELEGFWEAAGSLAVAAAGPAPPPALRGRLLETARAERQTVVPLRNRRRLPRLLGAAAAAAAILAIAIAAWSFSVSRSLDDARERLAAAEAAVAVLATPGARSVALEGAEGRLVVTPSGEAALLVRGLEPAPTGKAYALWVLREGGAAPEPAGLFPGRADGSAVRLSRPVPDGAAVAVTLEDSEGAPAPTTEPLLRSPRVAL